MRETACGYGGAEVLYGGRVAEEVVEGEGSCGLSHRLLSSSCAIVEPMGAKSVVSGDRRDRVPGIRRLLSEG